MTTSADKRYTELPIANIARSPLNPRKTFDEAKLAELAESIKQKGVLEPLLVRTLKPRRTFAAGMVGKRTEEGTYELVAGERRLRAAELAGLTAVPCIIREMSDRDADEIRVIENEQRQDLGAMEKADGYQALIDRHGATVEDLAAKVGKSVSTIRDLLRLRRVPDAVRKAVDAGVPLPPATRLPIAWGLIEGQWRDLGEAPSRSAALSLASDNGADRFAWLADGEGPPARRVYCNG